MSPLSTGPRSLRPWLRALAKHSSAPLLVIDPDGVVVVMNAAAELALGRSAADLVGSRVCELAPPVAIARVHEELTGNAAQVHDDHTVLLPLAPGPDRTLELEVSAVRSASGSLLGFLVGIEEASGRIPVPARVRQAAADDTVLERVVTMWNAGSSPYTIAAALNAEGLKTSKGTRWHARSVQQVLWGQVTRSGRTPRRAAG